MSDECRRKGKWIGGCRFEARYDKGPAEYGDFSAKVSSVIDLMETMRPITYVADVCVKCGRVVDRSTPPANSR